MAEAVAFALAEQIGKSDAHHLVETANKTAVTEKQHLRDVLAQNPAVTAQLGPDRLAQLFEPLSYQDISQKLIDRLLSSLDDSGVDHSRKPF
jgi:3-carboxy-cis,cis-muconate cycloisomerase